MKIDVVKRLLGDDAELVVIEKVGEVIKVSMKKYEAKEVWDRINKVLVDNGGEWISNGKLSHWKIPIQKEERHAQLTLVGHLNIAINELDYIKEKLKELQK